VNPVNGSEPLRIHPLNDLNKTADLVFFDGPLLSLFENAEQEPYLFLWADADENSNRWLAFRLSSAQLTRYLHRELSLRELVLQPADGHLFVAEIDADFNYKSVASLLPSQIPEAYLPAADSRYEFEPESADFDLTVLARKYGSALLDLHLIRGAGVRFGSSNVITLGSLLSATGVLTEAVAISLFASEGTQDSRGMTKEQARAYGTFEFVAQKAASFSAILRPIVTQDNLPGFLDRTEQVITEMLRLFTQTRDYQGLKLAAASYPDAVIRGLAEVLNSITARDAEVEFRWARPVDEVVRSAKVDKKTSALILDNINRLDSEDSERFSTDGFFIALDLKKKSYRFVSSAGRESGGRFDPKIAYPLTRLSFERVYRVYMTRKTIKLSGYSRPSVEEMIGEMELLENERPKLL
jgi:hypothetical protein